MTVVFLNFSGGAKTRSWQQLPRFVRPFLARPYAFFCFYHLTRKTLVPDFLLSYGFPRKLREGPYGSCDNAAIFFTTKGEIVLEKQNLLSVYLECFLVDSSPCRFDLCDLKSFVSQS